MLAETGEPHNRIYTVRCRLSAPEIPASASTIGCSREYIAEGQGSSKKGAKQAACEKLLDEIRSLLNDDPVLLAAQIVRQVSGLENKQGFGRNGKELHSKRRTIIKDKVVNFVTAQ